jgi:hypothetical protein
MPWNPGAATLVALGLAFTAHADGPLDNPVDGQPLLVADGSLERPDGERISRKTKGDWLQALAYKLESARSALQGHKLVVTSEHSEARTFTYDDVAKSVEAAEAGLADATAADSSAGRLDLALPERPNRDGDLQVKLTGGLDTVGVLVSKKM